MDRVKGDFDGPAENVSTRVNEVLEQYQSTHDKLHEFRKRMNNATVDANMATTMNAVNRKNLADMIAAIEGEIFFFFYN